MTMTDNRWAAVIVAVLCITLFLNYTYYKYRVEVIRGEVTWDIPTFNLEPLKKQRIFNHSEIGKKREIEMKKAMAASLIAALVATTSLTTLADTSSMSTSTTGMGVLENDYVKAGVNGTTGTFGSGGNTSPGLLFDSTGAGDFNTSYDYLTPGSPFDGWSIKIDGSNSTNNNASTGSAAWLDSDGLTDGDGTLAWNGTNSAYSGWEVEHIYSLGATSEFIDIETNITAGSSASDSTVYFGRFIDPDARAAPGDSSSTDNVLGYSGIPDTNVAFSEAVESKYALGLYSTNSNVDAGITGWTTDADSYTTSKYTDSDGNTVNYGTGDDTIGLTWVWTGVEAGDILTAEYSYIFGPSAFAAADSAIEGGAGGGTPGETPSDWGDVTDDGSATDAAADTGPTVVGTGTSTLTRHTATETGTTQTIAREKTTSTWDVYSDGSLGDASATTEDLTPFTGRIDQIASAKDAVSVIIKGLEFDGVTAIGKKNKFDNGMKGNTKGFAIGGTKQNDEGLIVGAGIANVQTTLKNNDDRAEATTRAGQLSIGRNLPQGSIMLKATHAMTDYGMERTIGDFSNSAKTSGTDTSVGFTYTSNSTLSPVVGYTVGVNKINEYTESGSIQSARSVAKSDDTYNYATVGATANIGVFDVTALHHTDKTSQANIGINKTTENGSTFGINVARTKTKLGTSDSITAGLSIKF